jgi:hypothetical protein
MKENSWKVSDTEISDYARERCIEDVYKEPILQVKLGHPGSGSSLLNEPYIREEYLKKELAKEDIFMPNYKFNEDKLLAQLRMYIDKTYTQHYSQNKIQATEFIIDAGHGVGFTLGNVIKYAQRYGKKEGFNRQDLLKVLHYAIIALHVHDTTNPNKEQK